MHMDIHGNSVVPLALYRFCVCVVPLALYQEYIREGKESILLCIAVCKHRLKSTEVKLAKITSTSITVMVTHPGV